VSETETIETEEKVWTEEIKVRGEELLGKVKELIKKGNVRRLAIKNEEGKVLVDIPVTLGVLGALVAPQLAALGAIAALVTNCTVVVGMVKEE
jgi:hypothetical protein